MYKFLIICVFAIYAFPIFSQNDLIGNVYNREVTSLNGDWKYIIDPYENGYYNYSKPKDKSDLLEYDFDNMEDIQVPGDWNSQKKELNRSLF